MFDCDSAERGLHCSMSWPFRASWVLPGSCGLWWRVRIRFLACEACGLAWQLEAYLVRVGGTTWLAPQLGGAWCAAGLGMVLRRLACLLIRTG